MENYLNEIYLHIFFENAGFIKFDLNLFENFLKYSIKFKNDSAISEDKNLLIDVPSKFFNYCYDHQNQIIKLDVIKGLMKESRHYCNFKNKPSGDLYFTIFDFKNDDEIKSFIFKVFNLKNDNEMFIKAFEFFEKYCKNIDGFINQYNDTFFCVINESSTNVQQTIYHELSHYIQIMCNIRIVKDFKFSENNERFKKLKNLNVSYEDLNYYFSGKEFYTHIDDLIIGLWNMFKKFYETKMPYEFISILNDEIEKCDDFENSKILHEYALVNNGDIAPFVMYASAFLFNHKFKKINKIILSQINKRFHN